MWRPRRKSSTWSSQLRYPINKRTRTCSLNTCFSKPPRLAERCHLSSRLKVLSFVGLNQGFLMRFVGLALALITFFRIVHQNSVRGKRWTPLSTIFPRSEDVLFREKASLLALIYTNFLVCNERTTGITRAWGSRLQTELNRISFYAALSSKGLVDNPKVSCCCITTAHQREGTAVFRIFLPLVLVRLVSFESTRCPHAMKGGATPVSTTVCRFSLQYDEYVGRTIETMSY